MPFPLSISSSDIKPLALILLWSLFTMGCKSTHGDIGSSFTDTFDGPFLGNFWHDTIGRYTVINQKLNINGAYNHPLWLKYSLPVEVDIVFDAQSLTKDGDIKVELFGDGRSFAFNRGAYVASGYVLCMGGWGNTKTFIARQAEHAQNLLVTTAVKVTEGKLHHNKIESRMEGSHLIINWFIDGKLALSMRDKHPLYGEKNRWFGFSNWASDVWFDNLKITPVKKQP